MSLRVAVTGKAGQLVLSLMERALEDIEVIALGRPQFDLGDFETVLPAIIGARPDIVVNAAAYTAVDKAESEPDVAMRINGAGAGKVAEVAASLGIPVIQISTDYVFDGALDRPYREDDSTGPISIYGASKLAGEWAVTAETKNYAILRTGWIYSPFGTNFVRTMLRLAETRYEVGVVADQIGCPSSGLDIADAVLAVARNLVAHPHDESLRGVFHMAAVGEAAWADVAEAIFAERARCGGNPIAVKRIATKDYPTPARRPANSRLECCKLAVRHGIVLPPWRPSLAVCVKRLLVDQEQRT